MPLLLTTTGCKKTCPCVKIVHCPRKTYNKLHLLISLGRQKTFRHCLDLRRCYSTVTPATRGEAETPAKRGEAETPAKRGEAETPAKRGEAETPAYAHHQRNVVEPQQPMTLSQLDPQEVAMPTLEFVHNSTRQLKVEQRKHRWLFNLLAICGVTAFILLDSRESDHFLWRVGTNVASSWLPPELAHNLVIAMGKANLLPEDTQVDDPTVITNVCNIPFSNPIGLAAGFDKSCDCPLSFLKMGFGFVEIGTVTPFPQVGNPEPRMFRLPEDQAVINRCGFNNVGVEEFINRLQKISTKRWENDLTRYGVIGINIDSNNPVWDYQETARRVAPYADYLVINISSPNTPGLRALQTRSQIVPLVAAVKPNFDGRIYCVWYMLLQQVLSDMMKNVEKQKAATWNRLKHEGKLASVEDERKFSFTLPNLTGKCPPLFLKIAPDLSDADLEDIAAAVLETNVDGIIISNTTTSRPSMLKSEDKLIAQAGGLSGKPLKDLSTSCVSKMYRLTEGKVPIIAVGGISTALDALEKIEAGASVVQIYTSMIYGGPGICRKIKSELTTALRIKGYKHVQEAIGAMHKKPKMSAAAERSIFAPKMED